MTIEQAIQMAEHHAENASEIVRMGDSGGLFATIDAYLQSIVFWEYVIAGLELLQEKKMGMVIEMPCKPGDMLFMRESIVENGAVLGSWIANKPVQKFSEPSVFCGWGLGGCEYSLSDFGKKVFLSREDAEKALAQTKGE